MLSIFSFISLTIIAVGLLFFGVFISQSGKLTQFINFLIVIYFSYYLWLDSSGMLYNNEEASSFLNSFEFIQEDTLFFRFFAFYTNIIIIVFFFGICDRFFRSKNAVFEFPFLIIFLHFGGLFALYINNFIDIFLALELATLTSYVLITFERQNRFSTYAGIQYFILGSLPSARLLIAFGLFYLQGGSVVFQDLDLLFSNVVIPSVWNSNTFFIADTFNDAVEIISPERNLNTTELISTFWHQNRNPINFFSNEFINNTIDTINPLNSIRIVSLFFLLFNFFFKLTAAPFHVWAPSVYGKGPIASVAFLSIYSKTRILFLRYKLINSFLHIFSFIILISLIFIGLLSIVTGIIGAFSEKTIKRFFVYSSRGHVGFILIGFGVITIEGSIASFHYLFVYILSSFIIWFRLLSIGRNKQKLVQLAELKTRNPMLALIFAFLIFSISGIPPFAGFFIKLDILTSVIDSSHFFVTYFRFLCTVISFFYYLRLIKIMFFDQKNESVMTNIALYSIFTNEAPYNVYRLWTIALLIIFLGCYMLFMHKPIFIIESQILSTLF